METLGDAVTFLSGSIKGETIGTDVFKLSFNASTQEPLYVKYIQTKTDVKGVAVEQFPMNFIHIP